MKKTIIIYYNEIKKFFIQAAVQSTALNYALVCPNELDMTTQINITPIINNFLDRRFQNLLFPVRCLQHMLFISSFSIEYNCIRPHRTSYYIVSLIGTLGFISFHLYIFFMQNIDNQFIIFFLKINIILLVIPFISFYILNIILRRDHVQVILEIQKALRLSNFKHYKKPIMRSWIRFVLHIVDYIISVTLTRDIPVAIHLYTLLYFEVNFTYGASIIALIRDGMISWISEVELYSKLSLEQGEEKYNDKLKKLFQAYINLMQAFQIFKNLFKFITLFQALDTFVHSLLYLQAVVEITISGITRSGMHDMKTFELFTVLWAMKNVTFVTIFSTYCERFYLSVSKADAACSRLLKNLQSTVEAKRLCKNVQRLNRAAFHKMSACGIFTIDGSLPREFNSLVLEYSLVILQFAVISWLNKYNIK